MKIDLLKNKIITGFFVMSLKKDDIHFLDYPVLTLLCQHINRANPIVSREDAFRLYQRGWRWVNDGVSKKEQLLIDSLEKEFGGFNV